MLLTLRSEEVYYVVVISKFIFFKKKLKLKADFWKGHPRFLCKAFTFQYRHVYLFVQVYRADYDNLACCGTAMDSCRGKQKARCSL